MTTAQLLTTEERQTLFARRFELEEKLAAKKAALTAKKRRLRQMVRRRFRLTKAEDRALARALSRADRGAEFKELLHQLRCRRAHYRRSAIMVLRQMPSLRPVVRCGRLRPSVRRTGRKVTASTKEAADLDPAPRRRKRPPGQRAGVPNTKTLSSSSAPQTTQTAAAVKPMARPR
jgi:hypothetical protein